MSKTDYKKQVVDFVKSAKPRSTGHKIVSQDGFLDGVVAQVEYTDSQSEVKQWVIVTKKYSGYADSDSQLIQQMNVATAKASAKWDWVNQIFNIGGLISLVLVVTASYLAIATEGKDIPEFLKASLLTIVGFYFGGYIHQSKKRKESDG